MGWTLSHGVVAPDLIDQPRDGLGVDLAITRKMVFKRLR